ncbi:MAG: copper chaperone PCu(A)C [Actinomycetota bacterium]|jgi:copper(I)-binding protein
MRRLVVFVALGLAAAACGGSTTSSTASAIGDVSDVHIFAASVDAASGSGDVAQVVADLHNASDAKDALVSVSCSCGGTATLFEPGAGSPATSIALPPQKVVLFGPRGARIELSDLAQPLAVGSTVTLTFSFETATPTSATAAVQAPGRPSPAT